MFILSIIIAWIIRLYTILFFAFLFLGFAVLYHFDWSAWMADPGNVRMTYVLVGLICLTVGLPIITAVTYVAY